MADSFMLEATTLKESGLRVGLLELAFYKFIKDLESADTGLTICWRVMRKKSTLMAPTSKAATIRDSDRVRENSNGLMAAI